MNYFATYLFLFALGAFFVPIISKCLRIPSLVGEILYGILLGYFLNTGSADLSIIDFLSNMGFIILMFLVGLELNFDQFTRKNIFYAVLTLLIFYFAVFLYWKYYDQSESLYMIIVYTAMSMGILFILLRSYNMEKTNLGQSLLMISSLGEIMTIISMILYEIYNRQTQFDYFPFLKNVLSIMLLFTGAYVLIRIILLFFWWFPGIVKDMSGSNDVSETNVRLSFLILLTMVAIASFFGLELILGAFLGGIMLSFVFREKEILQNKLSGIGYGFFIPFFFIKIGWDFKFSSGEFLPMILLSLKFYGIILVLRLLLSISFIPILKKQSLLSIIRIIVSVALLLSAPMTLLIAIAKLGSHIQVLDNIYYGALILTSLISSIIGPLLFSIIFPKSTSESMSPE